MLLATFVGRAASCLGPADEGSVVFSREAAGGIARRRGSAEGETLFAGEVSWEVCLVVGVGLGRGPAGSSAGSFFSSVVWGRASVGAGSSRTTGGKEMLAG
jgi:hypothetical protein